MGRRVVCAACDQAVDVEKVTTLKLVLRPPVVGGIIPMNVEASADLCSGECIARYVTDPALCLRELKVHVEKIVAVGAWSPSPRKPDAESGEEHTAHLLPTTTRDERPR